MPIVMKSSRVSRFGASLLLLGATAATTSCASSDESFNDPVVTPQPDAHKDTGTADTGADTGTGFGSCVPSSCPAPSEEGMIACCTLNNECGMKAPDLTVCISLLSGVDGGGGSGGANGGL